MGLIGKAVVAKKIAGKRDKKDDKKEGTTTEGTPEEKK